MAWTLIAHSSTGGVGGNNLVTTPAVDTTGANLIVIAALPYNGGGSVSDSKGNTWVQSIAQSGGGNACCQMFYCYAPNVGAGHTFSFQGAYAPVLALAFSGAAASPFDQSSNARAASPGAITPSAPNALLVTATGRDSGNISGIDSGFTISENVNFTGNSESGAIAWFALATPSSVNPTWVGGLGTGMISFKGPALANYVDLAGNFSV